ncbi:hypothetical protein HRbin01_01814 [archaeon HR01]|nr:hypothetical protein HRbin01_01814 [archaeon HR01]
MSKAVNELLRGELVGRDVEARYLGRLLRGLVVGETRNMVAVAVGDSVKKVPKAQSLFRFRLEDGSEVVLDGREIVGRPHERIRRGGRRCPRHET